MKLINNRYKQHIDFEKNNNYLLIIENSNEYLRVLQELYDEIERGIESQFVLSNNNEMLSIEKNVLYIYNYFDLDFNNKKIISEINNLVMKEMQKLDFTEYLSTINRLMIDINDSVLDKIDMKIGYDDDFSIDKFIKLSNYRISFEEDLISRLYAYIKTYCQIKGIKLVIIVGIAELLSKQDIDLLLKQINYLDIKCLLIEPFEKYEFANITRIIIDEDLCEI